MAALIGKEVFISFDGQTVMGKMRKFDPGLEYDTTETTSSGNTVMSKRVTLLKCEPKMTIIFDNDATGQLIAAKLKVGKSGQLLWGPEGNATGKPKFGATVVVTSASRQVEFNKEIEYQVVFANTGADMLFNWDVNASDVF